MDGMLHQPALPGIRIPDRSPLDMPDARARAVLQAASVKLRQQGAETRCLATVALADALEEASCGNDEAAFEALQSAAALRRMKA
jgi:hypothetical protein